MRDARSDVNTLITHINMITNETILPPKNIIATCVYILHKLLNTVICHTNKVHTSLKNLFLRELACNTIPSLFPKLFSIYSPQAV